MHLIPTDEEARRMTNPTRPFLKWVGGKTQLLPSLRESLPPEFGRYFEPFIGGGALFFDLRPRRASLRDVNAELVDCYRAVRDDVDGVIRALQLHRYDERYYYGVRDIEPVSLSLVERAARTIFLNKTGFNGLYRVNRGGKFNVPFGRYTKPNFCDERNLRACHLALQGVELKVGDFEGVVEEAEAGDLVYFDPPYAPISDTANFTTYVPGGFGVAEQRRLAAVFRILAEKGVNVMLSNSSAPLIRDLYDAFPVQVVGALRKVNATTSRRGRIDEVIVRSFRRDCARA